MATQDVYEMAYGLKYRDPGEATRKFKIVIQVTEADAEFHERAQHQLSNMMAAP